jgi:hypothetical protein
MALAGGIAVLAQLPIFDRWFSAMDEGHMLTFAEIVQHGGRLYRDATIYPLPGSFYLLSLAFELFEPSIRLTRWMVALEFGVFTALAWALLRRLVSAPWAWAGVAGLGLYRLWAFPHWQMYNYSTTALLLYLASALAAVRFFETRERFALAAAGLLFGLGVFCKQDYGAAALLATLPCLWLDARSSGASPAASLGWFLGPAAAVGGAAALHFLHQGMLLQVLQFTVLNHFVGLASYPYASFPSLLPLFAQDAALRTPEGLHNGIPGLVQAVHPSAFLQSDFFNHTPLFDTGLKAFVFGPRLLVTVGAVRLWRLRGELEHPGSRERFLCELLLWASAASLVLLSALYRPQDYMHLAVLTWPLVCLGVVWADALARARRRLAVGLGLAAAPLLAAGIAYSGWLAWELRLRHPAPIEGARGGVFVKPAEAELLRDVVAWIRARSGPGEPVAVMPYFPILHFLAERPGPHGSSYLLWPFPEYPDRDQRVVDALETGGTRIGVWNFNEFPTFPPVSRYAPGVFEYLVDHFEIERVFSYDAFGLKLAGLRRSSAEPEGVPLAPLAAEGRITVRSGVHVLAVEDEMRARFVDTAAWPFRPVLALRPSSGGARTELAISLDVPDGARLRTAVGAHPNAWWTYPGSAVRFGLHVERDGRRDTLATRELDPHGSLADRGWFPLEVSLEAYAGERVRLVFSTATDTIAGESLGMGGFGDPRLVLARDPARAPPAGP